MNHLPKAFWNVIAVLLVAGFGVAAWLLIGGDTSPPIRLAFAVSGSLGLLSVSRGGIFLLAGRAYLRARRWQRGCVVTTCVITIIVGVLTPPFIDFRDGMRTYSMSVPLFMEQRELSEYASKHGGSFPPDMHSDHIYRYIKKQSLGVSLVWCSALGGLREGDMADARRIVAAYAREPVGRYRPVLFLNGYKEDVIEDNHLLKMLRERPALLAHAKRARAIRDAAKVGKWVNPPTHPRPSRPIH